jgi:hypothetical protein
MADDPMTIVPSILGLTMTPDHSMTPLRALLEHAAALSSKDNRRFAETLSQPFMHVWPNGEILEYRDQGDVNLLAQLAKVPIDVESFGQIELESASLILDWTDLKAFRVRFRRYEAQGQNRGQAEGIYVVVRDGTSSWKVKLSIGIVPVK